MPAPVVCRSERYEGEWWSTMALLSGDDQAALTTTTATSWSLVVADTSSDTPNAEIYSLTAQAVGGYVFDTLQSGYGWSGSQGFNFRHRINPSLMSVPVQGGHTYRLEYTIQTVGDGPAVVVHLVSVVPLISS